MLIRRNRKVRQKEIESSNCISGYYSHARMLAESSYNYLLIGRVRAADRSPPQANTIWAATIVSYSDAEKLPPRRFISLK